MAWAIVVSDEFDAWHETLLISDPGSADQVTAAIRVLQDEGPTLGRPLVDHIKNSKIRNLKELRPGSSGRTELRILFCFDPRRQVVILLGGDKSADWNQWYTRAIPRAERLYEEHLRNL